MLQATLQHPTSADKGFIKDLANEIARREKDGQND
jgi:hypothetical protein